MLSPTSLENNTYQEEGKDMTFVHPRNIMKTSFQNILVVMFSFVAYNFFYEYLLAKISSNNNKYWFFYLCQSDNKNVYTHAYILVIFMWKLLFEQ